MNRHEDFCSDSTCSRCHPEAHRAYHQKIRSEAIQKASEMTDQELETALQARKQDQYKTRIKYLQDRIGEWEKKISDARAEKKKLEGLLWD